MKRIVSLLAGLFLMTALFATPASADVPALPHAFYGAVEINGSPAPIGTQVEARGTDVNRGIEGNPIAVAEAGKYGGSGGLDPKLVVQGEIEDGTEIRFYVSRDGVTWVEAESESAPVYWDSGEITKVDLSATIAAPAPAAAGGGVPPDTTAPTISAISIPNITETTADISWRTNEASTTQVEYWTSPSTLSPLDETMVFNHLVHLTGLTPGTTYHYKTMSRDVAGNVAVSDEDTFTTLGEAPAAVFTSSALSISPSEVNIGETVTISVSVSNTGIASGSYKVTLKINEALEATKEVTLNAGASREVTFTTAKDVAGSYSVAVNGLSGSFTVKEKVAPAPSPPPPAPPEVKAPINWPVVGGIIGGVIVVGLLVFFLVVRRRAY